MNANPDLALTCDAANWRELKRLLAEKAYGSMKPAQITALLPDLRAVYAEIGQDTAICRKKGGQP